MSDEVQNVNEIDEDGIIDAIVDDVESIIGVERETLLKSLATAKTEITNSLTSVQEQITTGIETVARQLTEATADLTTTLTNVTAISQQLSSKIVEAEAFIGRASKAFEALDAVAKASESKVTGIVASLESAASDITGLTDKVDNVLNNVSGLSKDIRNVSTSIDALPKEIGVNGLSKIMSRLYAKITKASD